MMPGVILTHCVLTLRNIMLSIGGPFYKFELVWAWISVFNATLGSGGECCHGEHSANAEPNDEMSDCLNVTGKLFLYNFNKLKVLISLNSLAT